MGITVKIEGELDDIGKAFEATLMSVSREILEKIALEGYRSEELTAYQVRQILGFDTPMEVDSFLKAHGVYLDYGEDELERDFAVSREASRKHRTP